MQFLSVPRFIAIFLFLISAVSVKAQEENLQQQFTDLKDQSETYTIYKVIKTDDLDGLWRSTMDTLNTSKGLNENLKLENSELQSSLDDKRRIEESLRNQLEESRTLNETISVFGMNLQKTAYHFMVWGIIIGLILGLLFVFGLFQRSNVVTVKTSRDYELIVAELESFREESREKQAKLKRELQTTINKLEETKRSKKSSLAGN